MRRRNRMAGQGTLEYLLVLIVILLGILSVSNTGIKGAITGVFNAAKTQIDTAATKWAAKM